MSGVRDFGDSKVARLAPRFLHLNAPVLGAELRLGLHVVERKRRLHGHPPLALPFEGGLPGNDTHRLGFCGQVPYSRTRGQSVGTPRTPTAIRGRWSGGCSWPTLPRASLGSPRSLELLGRGVPRLTDSLPQD